MSKTAHCTRQLTNSAGIRVKPTTTMEELTVSSRYGYDIDLSSQKNPRWKGLIPNLS